jgi:hypothetical protein
MLERIRRVIRIAASLPVRAAIGAILLLFFFANIQKQCEWMACTIYYNLDKPPVVVSLLLSVLILGHAAIDIARSLTKAPPAPSGPEMPTPMDHKVLMHQHAKLQGQFYQDSVNDC